MRLFARDGFEATTMSAVAAEAGIGRRTLFRYYPTKQSLAGAHWDGMTEEFLRLLEERPAAEPVAEAMMQALLAWIGKLSLEQLMALSDLPARTPELRTHRLEKYAHLERAFAEIAHRQRGGDGLASRVAATAVVQVWRMSYEDWLEAGRPGHVREIAAKAFLALRRLDLVRDA